MSTEKLRKRETELSMAAHEHEYTSAQVHILHHPGGAGPFEVLTGTHSREK